MSSAVYRPIPPGAGWTSCSAFTATRTSPEHYRDRVRVLLDVSAVPDQLTGAGVYTTELARAVALRDDLELVASFCHRVLVMYAGRIVEECRADALQQARHPYTQGLLACLPRIAGPHGPLPTLKRDPSWAMSSVG